jgi:hypothetical protein
MAAAIEIRRAPVLALPSFRNTRSVAKTTTPNAAICIRGKSKIRIHQASFRRRGRRVARTTTTPKTLTARLTSRPPETSTATIAVYQDSSRIRKPFSAEGGRNLLASAESTGNRVKDRPQLSLTGFFLDGSWAQIRQAIRRSNATAPRSAAQPMRPAIG